jgi:predicted cation transporter
VGGFSVEAVAGVIAFVVGVVSSVLLDCVSAVEAAELCGVTGPNHNCG